VVTRVKGKLHVTTNRAAEASYSKKSCRLKRTSEEDTPPLFKAQMIKTFT